MIYELYLEGQLADIRQDLGMQLSYAIDDVNKYGSRETSFSKTIVLPGTANNNRLLGFVGELGSNNGVGFPNIGANFNPAQTTKAELRANGLLLLKGVFRLTGIIKDGELVEYEGNLFGELGGFISAIGSGKLEDLDFSEYNHNYTRDNIVGSWDNKIIKNINGGFFNDFDLLFYIFPDSGNYDFKLKVGDTIVISNSANNNGTYTVLYYNYNPGVIGTSIQVNQPVITDNNDSFTIQYPTGLGTGYFYPLIDYGRYSADKLSYDYRTFRPALFVKEYIDKMFLPTGYTYESNFFNSEFFKRLIIPNNLKELKGFASDLLDVASNAQSLSADSNEQSFAKAFEIQNLKRSFTGNGDPNYTYTGTSTTVNLKYRIDGLVKKVPFGISNELFSVGLYKNGSILINYNIPTNQIIQGRPFMIEGDFNIDLLTNDTLYFQYTWKDLSSNSVLWFKKFQIKSLNPILTDTILNEPILVNSIIPRNILQKDFFTWILKMFNLYITEDKLKEKHLIIEPYKDYYDLTEYEDWTYKVARDKPWNIKPMGMLNGRFFEYKYKEDNDFYNEGYKKKYNLPYGSILHDTEFPFAKDKQTTDIGFSPTPLVKYSGRDKVVSAIYKVSKGNSVDQEEQTDSNIRILMVKKITGVAQWYITNNGPDLVQPPQQIGGSLTSYGYAGHFDDPVNPAIDINFGAADEIYFTPNNYPTNNLFNTYWSGYIGEIADKDSKLLTCHVYLTELDIAQLDFSKPVFIDGSLWRINKIMDFDASSGELTKVELLKVINNG